MKILKWLYNTNDPNRTTPDDMIPQYLGNGEYESKETTYQTWKDNLKDKIIGDPMPGAYCTVEQLKQWGIVGVYQEVEANPSELRRTELREKELLIFVDPPLRPANFYKTLDPFKYLKNPKTGYLITRNFPLGSSTYHRYFQDKNGKRFCLATIDETEDQQFRASITFFSLRKEEYQNFSNLIEAEKWCNEISQKLIQQQNQSLP